MSEKAPSQPSSKEDLDQLSALEESMAPFGMGDLDSEHGVILKDWSAQDFANIYVRFRPHLISHARKFLRDETQAEEVVQDAFLYLMTALPELDSELGVLRFLKWKTKMLCLDIIRSSQAGLNSNLVPLPDDVADESQPLDSLERADDAAIIRLALAKLNPRHREALIATTYEEKSHEEVAQQMGVGENAFRQLLFRARASFRKALVGEAEIEGKSVAEILSVAASKAARDSGTLIGGLGAFLALIGLLVSAGLGSYAPIPQDAAMLQEVQAVSPPVEKAQSVEKNLTPSEFQAARGPEVDPVLAPSGEPSVQIETAPNTVPEINSIATKLPTEGDEGRTQLTSVLDGKLATKLSDGLAVIEWSASNSLTVIEAENGLKAYVAFDLTTKNVIQYVHISFEVDDKTLTGVPRVSLSQVERGDQILVSFAATDLLVGDFDGYFGFASVDDSPFSRSGLLINLTLEPNGSVVSADLGLIPRT